MRLLTIACLLTVTSVTAFSQAGMYRTYRDFLDDKVMTEYPEYVGANHAFGKFTVTFKADNGREIDIKIKKNKFWGYKTEKGLIYKINQNHDPFLMVDRGVINAYVNFRSHFNEEGKLVFEYGSSFPPTFSVGDNGKMKRLTKSKLKRYVKKLGDKEDLKALKKTGVYPSQLLDFITEFNKKYRKDEKAQAKSS